MSEKAFDSLSLIQPILQALKAAGYTQPTPIQAGAIPPALEGKDLLATAQTGTGKTAAFSLPLLQRLHQRQPEGRRRVRALILTPTRELALQIDDNLRTYGRHLRLKTAVILGGVSAVPQIKALGRVPDILVATPGRLLDLMGQGHVRLNLIEALVLDEADRMLDMGFIHDVRRIVDQLPRKRQTLFFSATLPREIAQLAADMLHDPVTVEIAPPATVAAQIDQKVLFVDPADKRDLLVEILRGNEISRALVFTRTKHRADRIARQLTSRGVEADAIHSNKSQGARQRALAAFDRGKVRVLVATDIVARGIDVDGISHVINYELPNEPESYVHRIGRTARAGASGMALSLCASDEVPYLKSIEKLTGTPLTPVDDHTYHASAIAKLAQLPGNGKGAAPAARPSGQRSRNRRPSNGRRTNNRSGLGGPTGQRSHSGRLPARSH